MDIDPKEIIINHYYLGPGEGSSIEAIYLPTGTSVAEHIPSNSTESGPAINSRLVAALKLKIQEKIQEAGSSGEGES